MLLFFFLQYIFYFKYHGIVLWHFCSDKFNWEWFLKFHNYSLESYLPSIVNFILIAEIYFKSMKYKIDFCHTTKSIKIWSIKEYVYVTFNCRLIVEYFYGDILVGYLHYIVLVFELLRCTIETFLRNNCTTKTFYNERFCITVLIYIISLETYWFEKEFVVWSKYYSLIFFDVWHVFHQGKTTFCCLTMKYYSRVMASMFLCKNDFLDCLTKFFQPNMVFLLVTILNIFLTI